MLTLLLIIILALAFWPLTLVVGIAGLIVLCIGTLVGVMWFLVSDGWDAVMVVGVATMLVWMMREERWGPSL